VHHVHPCYFSGLFSNKDRQGEQDKEQPCLNGSLSKHNGICHLSEGHFTSAIGRKIENLAKTQRRQVKKRFQQRFFFAALRDKSLQELSIRRFTENTSITPSPLLPNPASKMWLQRCRDRSVIAELLTLPRSE